MTLRSHNAAENEYSLSVGGGASTPFPGGTCLTPLHQADSDQHPAGCSRRGFLKALLVGAAGAYFMTPEEVYAKTFATKRQLSFHHLNTNEKLDLVVGSQRRYDRATLYRLSHFLRDHRTGQVHAMDPGLLDILLAVTAFTHSRGSVQVICGYRSPQTNAFLHQTSRGVAEHSLHMVGKAIDLRLSDVGCKTLHKAGIAMQRGGVGYYRDSDFVHLDTGPFRTW